MTRERPVGARPTLKLGAEEKALLDSVEHGEWTSVGRQKRTESRCARYPKPRFEGIAG